mmetsp:Transcript_17041/g.57221  ORF Transcript_17041/g.57221 Transcript_17041/m.57221 type:complete len:237 (+) Transcript_17041:2042-2752(+)
MPSHCRRRVRLRAWPSAPLPLARAHSWHQGPDRPSTRVHRGDPRAAGRPGAERTKRGAGHHAWRCAAPSSPRGQRTQGCQGGGGGHHRARSAADGPRWGLAADRPALPQRRPRGGTPVHLPHQARDALVAARLQGRHSPRGAPPAVVRNAQPGGCRRGLHQPAAAVSRVVHALRLVGAARGDAARRAASEHAHRHLQPAGGGLRLPPAHGEGAPAVHHPRLLRQGRLRRVRRGRGP